MTIQEFAEVVKRDRLDYMRKFCKGFTDNDEEINRLHYDSSIKATVKPGNKYTKVDVGSSGKYMIDNDGNIYGIKAYGVIHKGHHYGTLETVNDWYWGNYSPQKIK